LMKSEPELTDNYSTPNNWSPEKKMPPITLLEDTIPSVKKSLISALTESENLLTNVPVSKVSVSSTLSEEELDLDSDLSS
jgi:hypothetical protein